MYFGAVAVPPSHLSLSAAVLSEQMACQLATGCRHTGSQIEDDVGVYQSTDLLIYRFLILATRVQTRTLTLVL